MEKQNGQESKSDERIDLKEDADKMEMDHIEVVAVVKPCAYDPLTRL